MKRVSFILIVIFSFIVAILQPRSRPILDIPFDKEMMPGQINVKGYCFWEYADELVYCELATGSVIETRSHIIQSATYFINDKILGDFISSWGQPIYESKGAFVNYLYWWREPYIVSTRSKSGRMTPTDRVVFITYSQQLPEIYKRYGGFN